MSILIESKINNVERIYFLLLTLLIVFCTVGALFFDNLFFAIVPLVFLGILTVVKDYRYLYFGIFLLLPFSVEVNFGSLGTDLPSEPMMLTLTGVALLVFIFNFKNIPKKIVYHPISALLLIHLMWILVTVFFAKIPLISLKFFLAKTWYVIPFYFFSFKILRTNVDIYLLFKSATYLLVPTVLFILGRHYFEGFTFESSNRVVYPIFRNHVSYAAMIVTLLPYLWVLWCKDKSIFHALGIIILVVGTYFSFTRAAHLCIFIMIASYYIYKYKLAKYAISLSFVGAIALVIFLLNDNKYLEFAPDFNKTITHKNFDNLLEATYKMEDISTMERVYRWVAGIHMIGEEPLTGFGPSNFYENYTKFTISSFETYVSHNPEKSGIHCYYLMTCVEQGFIGLFIFLTFCTLIILIGERVYHNLTNNDEKQLIMAALLSTTSILALQIINDLIETDKVGPFFFINASIIVIYSLKSKKNKNQV